MQLQPLSHRGVKTGSAFGLAAATCLLIGLSSASADEHEKPAPPVAPAPGEQQQGPSSPDYWSGTYWDAQDGKSFWHRLLPGSRHSPKANAEDKPEKAAVNGSLRIRNENRARRR